jgi:hypothetical protein
VHKETGARRELVQALVGLVRGLCLTDLEPTVVRASRDETQEGGDGSVLEEACGDEQDVSQAVLTGTERWILFVVIQDVGPMPDKQAGSIQEELAVPPVVHIEPLLASLLQIQGDVGEMSKHFRRKNMDCL